MVHSHSYIVNTKYNSYLGIPLFFPHSPYYLLYIHKLKMNHCNVIAHQTKKIGDYIYIQPRFIILCEIQTQQVIEVDLGM